MIQRFDISDPRHGIYGLVKFVVVGAIVIGVLGFNANRFDADEIEKWIQIMVGIGAIQGGMGALKYTARKREEKCDHPDHNHQ